MNLVQLLLPVYDNNNQPFSKSEFDTVRKHLVEEFGGVTAFLRSPAVGLWKESDHDLHRDDVVMFEVMTNNLDEVWWRDYRKKLEATFKQEEVLVWASEVRKL